MAKRRPTVPEDDPKTLRLYLRALHDFIAWMECEIRHARSDRLKALISVTEAILRPILAPAAKSKASVTLPPGTVPSPSGESSPFRVTSAFCALRPLLPAKEIRKILDDCRAAVEPTIPYSHLSFALDHLDMHWKSVIARFKATNVDVEAEMLNRERRHEQMEAALQQLVRLLQPFYKLRERVILNLAGIKGSLIEGDITAYVAAQKAHLIYNLVMKGTTSGTTYPQFSKFFKKKAHNIRWRHPLSEDGRERDNRTEVHAGDLLSVMEAIKRKEAKKASQKPASQTSPGTPKKPQDKKPTTSRSFEDEDDGRCNLSHEADQTRREIRKRKGIPDSDAER